MRRSTKLLYDVVHSIWFIVAGLALLVGASVVGTLSFAEVGERKTRSIGRFIQDTAQYLSEPGILLLILTLAVIFTGFFYSIRVRWENTSLRNMARIFYEINDCYKAELRRSFSGDKPMEDRRELSEVETKVLRSVCQRIANIYTMAIGRPCVVTIKLIQQQPDNPDRIDAFTHLRSEERSRRDEGAPRRFSVNTGDNTGMDRALAASGDTRPSHYFSADLKKSARDGYCNERQHYLQYYKSVLVVPIRGEKMEGPRKVPSDLIGFLSVDTMSTNRLNDRYHLYMLAALAHQMYNFMSLMRGNYIVLVSGKS